MTKIKIKCPAKINLTLEIVNKREDGFHNIKSIMQTINLYDYLTITVENAYETKINLSGNSTSIPYDEKNLVYKACDLFLKKAKLQKVAINVYIEKNIPIAAGLAGGSTDATGTLYGLNKTFKIFDNETLNELCAKLGSDLNVCLQGGCLLATSRGEIIKPLPFINRAVTLIKPKELGISAKEAYTKYSLLKHKQNNNMTEKMVEALSKNGEIKTFLYNDLEHAVFNDYKELQEIKKAYPSSIMSGSGSTYFILENIENSELNNNYQIISNLQFTQNGVCEF